ncbi:hypothetical protein PQC07_gp207 [Aeromonas phage D3]|uniref:Uncharacterized protein n=2 Tax=Ludhianavirus TaxID=3044751 RepID=A0A514TVL5_9CAUD|nr:hypothetical protein PQC07_gp207 [Aeromonas phage D3]YP_010668814.1 hypothetical protein PQC08_gp209 [Aeromonas phage D6]QDJ97065.1 hypothetical protein D3_0068 [Aeromonas phage D3]QDJ97226.1 hypothetical protein D6_0066 [Aeromonas phage D6]
MILQNSGKGNYFTFSFILTGRYEHPVSNAIGYGLTTMISMYTMDETGEEVTLSNPFNRDAARYIMEDYLLNYYTANSTLSAALDSACSELLAIVESPQGDELENFLCHSYGVTECFTRGEERIVKLFIKEGGIASSLDELESIQDSMFRYDEYASVVGGVSSPYYFLDKGPPVNLDDIPF